MLAVVAPGQGSQTPGFLSPWLELDGVRATLEHLCEAADLDLVVHGTTSDAATIQDTAIAQPLLVGAGLACMEAVLPGAAGRVTEGRIDVLAGHSVGEVTAASLAGVLAPADAMALVRVRGDAMAEASAAVATGMSAVIGGDPGAVEAALDAHGLTPANINGAGQVVAAGTLEQLAALAADPPPRAKVIPLKVAGAFHTAFMAPAVERLEARAATVTADDPRTTLLGNADGDVVADGPQVLRRLVQQVSRPVRWDLCQQRMAGLGVTALLELPPAGTLANLAKRALPGVEIVAVRTPDDVAAARELADRHATAPVPQPQGGGS